MRGRLLAALTAALTMLPASAAMAAPKAHVWVTTPDGAQRMNDNGTVAFARGGSDELTISVDPSHKYQRMDGFGASITDSSASLLAGLDPAVRRATMRSLFARDGLSFLRQPMGASDFVDGPHYTYDDVPAGQTDYGLRRFSIAHDKRQILPLVREALALNPKLKVMATPWSPPAWMKTNQSLIGGRLIDSPRIYATYAQYFVEFIKAYRREGVPIYAVTVQNEPQNRNPSGYPGADVPVAQEAKLINELGPRLRRAGLRTKIFGYDHNWAEHPNDIASTPPGEDPETEYPTKLLNTSAGRWIAGTAFHCYAGDQVRQTQLQEAFPDKGVWFTECSGSHGLTDPPAQVFSDTLKWHSRNLVLGVPRNWGKTVVNWNLALDPAGGPHNGGCDTCTGVVTVNGDTVTENAEYYTLGHLARFVQPGAERIASTSFGTTGWNGQIMDAAFRNRDGTTALVVHNENDDPRTFAVAEGGYSFAYTLPGGALATFTWRDIDDGRELVPAHGTTPDTTSAFDDDATTRWTTGAAQQPGQSLVADLDRARTVNRVVLDTGVDRGDYPRGYTLALSDDGTHWRDVASGAGSGQLTTIDFRPARARYLRVTQTGSAPNWWSVAEVRVSR